MVNGSPWGSTLAATALRFARAAIEGGHVLEGVWFQGDGVYNALRGDITDPGAEDLAAAWADLAQAAGCELLVCSSACARRLPGEVAYALAPPSRVAGLGELLELVARADRTVVL